MIRSLESFPVCVDRAELPLRCWRAMGAEKTHSAVFALHGANSSSDTFLVPHGGLSRYLAAAGLDVWLLDYRGSCRLTDAASRWGRSITFEDLARGDVAAALDRLQEVGAYDEVALLGHCIGGACVSIAIALGIVERFPVTNIVLSTLGLFFDAPLESFFKADDGILERMSIDVKDCAAVDPARPDVWPAEMRSAFDAWPGMWHRFGDSKADRYFRQLSFMVGAPYDRRNVDAAIHARACEHFGPLLFRLYQQAAQCTRRGVAAPLGAPENGPEGGPAGSPYLCAKWFHGKRVTLITGKSNELWHRSSIDRMYEWLRNETSGVHQKHVLPGYAHQDLFWGRSAHVDVYPHILDGVTGPKRHRASRAANWSSE